MSYLYVKENGAVINFQGNRFCVSYKDGLLSSVPAETLESIEVFGNVSITTPCLVECLKRGIPVIFYSKNGAYYGRVISTDHVNVERQRKQTSIAESYKLTFSKSIIKAKIHNQSVVIRRYGRNQYVDCQDTIIKMKALENRVESCQSIEQIMGYEGSAARLYFSKLSELINQEFKFSGRTRRPPKDPFNSLISLGYSIVMNELYGKLEAKGLNPYFGMLHQDKEKHPTLASDLLEEWRAVLIDSLALSLLNGNEIKRQDFYEDDISGGTFLTDEGFKLYLKKLESKFHETSHYLTYVDYPVSFRRALDLQVNQLAKSIEEGDSGIYQPIRIR